MTTDTPRTDAARTLGGVIVNDSWTLLGEPRSFDSINVVPADFARELERELAISLENQLKTQAEVERLKSGFQGSCYCCEPVGIMNQKLQAEVERLKSDKAHLITQCANLLEALNPSDK